MQRLKFLIGFFLMFSATQVEACRYTIREIGFSALNKVTYILYRVDENSAVFPKQVDNGFANANIKTYGLHAGNEPTNPVVTFAKSQNLGFPVYVLVDSNKRMLALSTSAYKNNINAGVLSSPVQQQLVAKLPVNYATVLLIEGKNAEANKTAKTNVLKTCEHITNIMPNMPKQVEVGPDMTFISNKQFTEEKVLLWSLGITEIPEEPVAFILYGKGRIMGEKVAYNDIIGKNLYKLLSIIGADCECGLDKKWMLGYQVPLDWPKETRQGLSDRLGFDVDNPMVLTEMSRILAIENRAPKNPDGISFEPEVIDLDEAFNDIPEIEHIPENKEEALDKEDSGAIVWYSLIGLLFIIGIASYFIINKKQ